MGSAKIGEVSAMELLCYLKKVDLRYPTYRPVTTAPAYQKVINVDASTTAGMQRLSANR